MATWTLGKNAKIYYGIAAADLAALTEMSNIFGDVKLTLDAAEADITTRASGGWNLTAPGRRSLSSDFDMIWNPEDPAFVAIQAAYLTGTTLELAILTGDKAGSGTQGPKATFCITKFDRTESPDGVITASVTVKPSVFGEWVDVV
jgi:hypothetical protein